MSPWQARAHAAGLQQKVLAEITGKTEINVSQQLRGMYGGKGEPPRYVVATIIAWELMTLDQREEWLAQLGSKGTVPTEHFTRSVVMERFRAAVRARREELSLSREQIANAIGTTRRMVKDFEDGADVPMSVAAKIAESVGLSIGVVDTATASGIAGGSAVEKETDVYDISDSLPDDLEGA
jgi:DNA-binding transcriptional regulator YiaG